jgi:hypothetical protein
MKSLLARRKVNSSTKRFNAGWQVLADEMTDYFGKNCYWIFWKKEEWKIRAAFKVCQERGVRNVGYLLGVIKRL